MSGDLLPLRLTICGIHELDGFARADVSDVLSIVNPGEPDPEAFMRFGPHRRTTLRFHDVVLPTEGHSMPAEDDMRGILNFGETLARHSDAGHLLVHCVAGVSRSTAAAAILMAQKNPGREAEAFLALLELRPRAWPNSRMVELADALLQRRGRLRAGLDAYYRAAIKAFDGMEDYIRSIGGREHELPKNDGG